MLEWVTHSFPLPCLLAAGVEVDVLRVRYEPLRSGRTALQIRPVGVDTAWSTWHTADLVLGSRGDAILLMTDGIADDLPRDLVQGFPPPSSESSASGPAGRAQVAAARTHSLGSAGTFGRQDTGRHPSAFHGSGRQALTITWPAPAT
jgi:hypothetical protein